MPCEHTRVLFLVLKIPYQNETRSCNNTASSLYSFDQCFRPPGCCSRQPRSNDTHLGQASLVTEMSFLIISSQMPIVCVVPLSKLRHSRYSYSTNFPNLNSWTSDRQIPTLRFAVVGNLLVLTDSTGIK